MAYGDFDWSGLWSDLSYGAQTAGSPLGAMLSALTRYQQRKQQSGGLTMQQVGELGEAGRHESMAPSWGASGEGAVGALPPPSMGAEAPRTPAPDSRAWFSGEAKPGPFSPVGQGRPEEKKGRNWMQNVMSAASIAGLFMSDPNVKEDVAPVDHAASLDAVEQMPISSWRYKGDPARHVGPMAPDFRGHTGLGDSDRAIHAVDGVGLGLSALKELAQRVRALEKRRG